MNNAGERVPDVTKRLSTGLFARPSIRAPARLERVNRRRDKNSGNMSEKDDSCIPSRELCDIIDG